VILKRTRLVVGNGSVTTDDVPSIQALIFRHGSVVSHNPLSHISPQWTDLIQIDGLAVTYAQGSSQDLTTLSHGTSLTAVDSGLLNTTMTLGSTLLPCELRLRAHSNF
jgi:hypothetical protein